MSSSFHRDLIAKAQRYEHLAILADTPEKAARWQSLAEMYRTQAVLWSNWRESQQAVEERAA